MKCNKCGFESNGSFCPMCGATLSENFNTAPANEQQVGVNLSEDNPTAYYAEVNPYQQTPQSAPIPQQNIPTPTPSPQAQQPKKSGKALYIVLSIIVCTVIVVGTVINVVSSILYKNSAMDLFSNIYDIYDYYDSYNDDPYYEDYKTDEDTTIHAMNEVAEFKYGNIKLTDIKITKENFEFEDSIRECAFTFEVENTTDDTIKFSAPSVQVCSVGDNYYETCYEWMYDDYETSDSYYGEFAIDAGKTKTFVSYYKVPADVNDFSIMFDIYDYDYIYNFLCYYEASLPQTETTAPATEPTTQKTN